VTDPHPSVAVLSTASIQLNRETSRSLEEMLFDASREALASAGMSIDDMDAVVVSGNDETDGRVISIMPASGPTGGVGRDLTMTASSGDHALIYGWMRVRAGQSGRVLVVGWSKPSEGVDPDHAELVEAEPYLLRDIGMNHTAAAALQASLLQDATTGDGPVVAWPLTAGDLPVRGDTVHALVIAADGAFEPGAEQAWILDCGWATGAYELGQRELAEFSSLRAALGQVEARGEAPAPASWDAAEIGADSEPAVRAVAGLLGLADGAAVNPSGALGGVITSPHVQGLTRMVAAIQRVAQGAAAVAGGIGFHGFAGQGATVAVFAGQKGAGQKGMGA